MPLTAIVVSDVDLFAGVAAQCVPSQRRATALFDGRHDFQLAQAQVAALRLPPSRTVGAEDVRDLQAGAFHDAPYAGCKVSSGLITSRRRSGATWSYSAVVSSRFVAEQGLDDSDVDLLLKQMGGETVAQDVHGYTLVDPRQVCGGMDGAVQLPRAERIDGILSWEQPTSMQDLAFGTAVFHQARRQSSSAGNSMA